MIGLGIESTAHTFSCAVIEKKGKKVKSYLMSEKFFDLKLVKEFILEKHLVIILKIVHSII
jgi:hypothetical protein